KHPSSQRDHHTFSKVGQIQHFRVVTPHCIGWLMNQIGAGNNIPLRLQVRSCENINAVVVDGPQHERFEDTLPKETV
ncbi:hypothetical protein ACFFQG_32100, partial [Shinella granuli]